MKRIGICCADTARIVAASVLLLIAGRPLEAANQTETVTPVTLGTSQLPYRIAVREYGFGTTEVPTLQSFAAGHHNGLWVMLAGRTNGLHGFENSPLANFPPEEQNRDIWVIDPVNKQSWHRSLDDPTAGLSEDTILSLTPTNNQFFQRGETLYMTGGYGIQPSGGFGTFDELTAIDLPGLVDWVVAGQGTASSSIRQISDPVAQVTGGAMYEIDGRTHLVFGQDFQGGYRPDKVGTYTKQVRSFEFVDDGVNLSIQNVTTTPPLDEYRRRDLNVYPVLKPGAEDDAPVEGLTVLSGVFTPTFGAWTVPVEIDADGNPTMADPEAPETFKQGFNNYHSAKLGLYSDSSGEMHEILFGGITLQTLNTESGLIETDEALPFVNDITSVVVDGDGHYSQHRIAEFPAKFDLEGKRLRYGANAEFFAADDIARYGNGVIDLDAITAATTLGYIFGGIVANGPHTRGVEDVISAASNTIFEVVLLPGLLEGDYNGDGSVDLADYALWKSTFGSRSDLLADGNDDGVVNSADYTIWRDQLGAGATAFQAVPEPKGLAAIGLLLAWAALRWRRSDRSPLFQ